jgi:hypothetical protein
MVKRIDGKRLRFPPGVRHWFSYMAAGSEWDVVLVDRRAFGEIDGRDGVTLPDQGLVALDDQLPFARLVTVLVHEMLHTHFSTTGESKLLARILGCAVDDASDREEEIVTHLAPKLADTLMRNGLLKLPPLPKVAR